MTKEREKKRVPNQNPMFMFRPEMEELKDDEINLFR